MNLHRVEIHAVFVPANVTFHTTLRELQTLRCAWKQPKPITNILQQTSLMKVTCVKSVYIFTQRMSASCPATLSEEKNV